MARKGVWVLTGTLVMAVAAFAATDSGTSDTPDTAAAPVTQTVTDTGPQTKRPTPPSTTEAAPPAAVAAPTPTDAAPAAATPAPTATEPAAAKPAPPVTAAAPAPTPAPTPTSPPPPPPPPPPPTTTAPPPPPAPAGIRHGARNTGCEQYMYNQINAARAAIGRPALAFDTGIQYIAVGWSDDMAGKQVLAHNPNYGNQILKHRDYRTAGENVGRGHEQGSLFQAFMNSPGHRANIESASYSHVTVGCLADGNGQLWVTQNFWG